MPRKRTSFLNTADLEFTVGNYVYGYRTGLHQVTKIVDRLDANPLVYLDQVLDGNFQPRRGSSICDSVYCRKVDISSAQQEYKIEQISIQEKYDRLIGFLRVNTVPAN